MRTGVITQKVGMTRLFLADGRHVPVTVLKLDGCPVVGKRTEETDGYTARRHLETVHEYAPQIHFDYVLVNNHPISVEQAERYAAEGARQIGLTDHKLEEEFSSETEIVRADLLDEGEKVRHSPDKLTRVIVACYEQAASARQLLAGTPR